tara:strand:+ start:182 stop:511 length:330 start_codon:yes stop_codon:yes gene_type:complete
MLKWLHQDEGWKLVMALVYAIICIFDFILVPVWIGGTRTTLDSELASFTNLDVQVQLALVKSVWAQHEPFTLMGGGMFHLAFGALLTGSAVTGKKTVVATPTTKGESNY